MTPYLLGLHAAHVERRARLFARPPMPAPTSASMEPPVNENTTPAPAHEATGPDWPPPKSIGMITKRTVLMAVARWYGTTPDYIRTKGRTARRVHLRQITMALSLKLVHGASTPKVGRYYGYDHTTVLHARDTVARKMADDVEFADEVSHIERGIVASRIPATSETEDGQRAAEHSQAAC